MVELLNFYLEYLNSYYLNNISIKIVFKIKNVKVLLIFFEIQHYL